MVGHLFLPSLTSHVVQISWFLLLVSVSVHVYDEARNGFLEIYNPTVSRLRARFPFLRFPVFSFRTWIIQLVSSIVVAVLLTPLSVHDPDLFRPIATIVAGAMILNGLSHLAGTLVGHTFRDIRISRPMPGTYSSPALIGAAIWVLIALNHAG